MKEYDNRAIRITVIGILGTLFAIIAMNTADDFGGIVFIPIAFFIGPVVILVGLIKGLLDRRKNSKKQNYLLLCVTTLIVLITAIGYLWLKAKENRANYCNMKYPAASIESYNCSIHKID